MPYKVFKDGEQYCVHKLKADGSKGSKVKGGCHASKSDAEKHKRALYSNVTSESAGNVAAALIESA